MKPASRTKLAIALFLPLAAVVLAMFACLPAPVGDPETSKIDPALTGAWINTDNDQKMLALLTPWDTHTYLLQNISLGKSDGKETHQISHFKAWLTTFGNANFITAQPLDEKYDGKQPSPPFWVVGRINKTPAGLEFRMVDPDSELLKNLGEKPTRDQIEAVIKAHVEDNALYGKAIIFTHAADAEVADALKKINAE